MPGGGGQEAPGKNEVSPRRFLLLLLLLLLKDSFKSFHPGIEERKKADWPQKIWTVIPWEPELSVEKEFSSLLLFLLLLLLLALLE